MRRALLATVVPLLALLAAPPARAAPVDDAARALRSDPVYVAPDAQRRLTADEERRLERLGVLGDRVIA